MDIMKNAAREKSMIDLYNSVAHAQYMFSTRKSFDELKEYLAKNTKKWSELAEESDFYSIQDCIESAREVASRAVDKENFRRFYDSLDTKILKS